jgi:hypothetical protein
MMSFRTRERDLFGVFDRAFDAQVATSAFCTHAFPSCPFSAFQHVSVSAFPPPSTVPWSRCLIVPFQFSAFYFLPFPCRFLPSSFSLLHSSGGP